MTTRNTGALARARSSRSLSPAAMLFRRASPPTLVSATVSEARISCDPEDADAKFAEYKFEVVLSDKTTLTRWRRWRECKTFTVDLYAASGAVSYTHLTLPTICSV